MVLWYFNGLRQEKRNFLSCINTSILHDDVIKWKHFPRNWPFVREIHWSPVNFPHKGQWRGALMFSLIYAWMNDWVNNREAGDLRRQHGHYDVIVMIMSHSRLVLLSCPRSLFYSHILNLRSSYIVVFVAELRTLNKMTNRSNWPKQQNLLFSMLISVIIGSVVGCAVLIIIVVAIAAVICIKMRK